VSVVPTAGVVSFARGVPSSDLLPTAALAAAAAAVPRDALNYGPPAGYEPLRELLGERYGVPPTRVLLTPGSMIGLNLLFAELGGPIALESPTYDRALTAARAVGAELLSVPRTHDGPDIASLAAACDRARVLYVLPTFHNPTGTTMSPAARHALAHLAAERGLPVVEDDPYGALRFEGASTPTLFGVLHELGAGELAVRVGSFSKSVAPGLRVGYAIVPEPLAVRLERRALDLYVSPPILPQAQLLAFLLGGGLEPHLTALRTELRRRRDALLAGLEEAIPDATVTRPEGGYFAWAELPPALDAEALLAAAATRGVTFVPGRSFDPEQADTRHARFAFSHASPDEIAEGCRRLADAVACSAA
jgi:DNA-binding transcriptional MocR family regulator